MRETHQLINCLPPTCALGVGGYQIYNPGMCPSPGIELMTLECTSQHTTIEPQRPEPFQYNSLNARRTEDFKFTLNIFNNLSVRNKCLPVSVPVSIGLG